MSNNIFSDNLKKFRIAKNLTQEQVAKALNVNSQTVSRWECSTTLPDVMTLPEIAKLYGVTVDDLYRKHSVAYDNYAQRLSSVYEKTRDPEDFIRCRLEYQKLMENGELSMIDKWNYATIHHFMSRYCKDIALEWYDKAIADGSQNDQHIYMRSRSLRNKLMFEIGRGEEVIAEQKEKCFLEPYNSQEWVVLIDAYLLADNYEEAYSAFQKAMEMFPDNWMLYIYGGYACEGLKRYDEAFAYWDKAGELGTAFYDEYYTKGSAYVNLGEYEKAYDIYMELVKKLRSDNYDVEAEMAENVAKEIKLKMK